MANLQNPGKNAAAVTKSDVTQFAPTRGLYVGGAGDVKVDMAGTGTAITFVGVPAGTLLPIAVTRVYSATTTATNIVRIY